jgi:hypothetical protein
MLSDDLDNSFPDNLDEPDEDPILGKVALRLTLFLLQLLFFGH